MRAAVATAAAPWLAVVELPDPVPEPGELVLRVDACGICGSDLHMAGSMPAGTVFGHEFSGTVVAIGAEAQGYQLGDRVVGFPLAGCRRCSACRSGAPGSCRQASLTGAQRPGGYAEYVAVGAAESFRLPDQLTAELGALVEPLAVAHHALAATPRAPDEPVLVLGAGPVGLAVGLWAHALGSRAVAVTDPSEHRRALAARLGFAVIDPAVQDVAAGFVEVAGRRPRAVLECVGRPGMIQQAVEVAGREAQVTLVGACTAPETFQPIVATGKELCLRFVVYYRRSDFAQTLDAMTSSRLDPAPLITGRVGLDELPERFSALMTAGPDCKVMIEP